MFFVNCFIFLIIHVCCVIFFLLLFVNIKNAIFFVLCYIFDTFIVLTCSLNCGLGLYRPNGYKQHLSDMFDKIGSKPNSHYLYRSKVIFNNLDEISLFRDKHYVLYMPSFLKGIDVKHGLHLLQQLRSNLYFQG